jgi:replicative DNA helicase
MTNRIPPQNLDAEQAVLGSILLNGEAINEVADTLLPDDFYRDGHKAIYSAMLAIAAESQPVDLITVTSRLKTEGKLDVAGGPGYLASLSDAVPMAANIGHYAKLVRDCAKLRRLIVAGQELVGQCYDHTAPEVALDVAEASLMKLISAATTEATIPMRELAKQVFAEIEHLATSGVTPGIPTGFCDLDKMTGGLCPADLTIIAGRPSMGKTALATNICRNVALESQLAVGVFSLEMSKEQLGLRLFADLGGVDLRTLRQGRLAEQDWPRITRAYSVLAESRIFIDDTPGLSVMALRTRARRLKAKHNIGLIVIDYLQLMNGKGEKREQEISDISRSLKNLAKELGVPVVALSQLNRDLEKRPNKRPILSDLRESGALEQDADNIFFVYRDEVYNKSPDNPARGIAELIIGKQRNGPTGTIELAWIDRFSSFRNLATRAM